MVTKIHRDALRGDIASLRALLDRSAGHDPLGSRTLQKRLRNLETELSAIEAAQPHFAEVALVFDGGPVRGSSAIDADFAGKALQDYQELIAKHIGAQSGKLGERGPLSDRTLQKARLNITGLMYGSFGFVLEEDSSDQLGMFETAAQKAVCSTTDLLQKMAASDRAGFDTMLPEIDIRIFQTLKRFIATLHTAQSSLRIAERQREIKLDSSGIERAFDRISQAHVEEFDETIEGELLGLVPVTRLFDFRRADNYEVMQGRVAVNLSADYLERIERDGLIAGGSWRATVRTKTVHQAEGRRTSVARTLVDLVRL